MFPFSLDAMLKKAQEMRGVFETKLQERSKKNFEGEAGAGMVKVTLNGLGDGLKLEIDPSLLHPQEGKVLNQLVLGAFNQAMAKVKEDLKQEVSQFLPR